LLDGKQLPHDLLSPALSVTQENLDSALKGVEKGGIVTQVYTVDDVAKLQAKPAAALTAN